jgi:hypothetical protein
MAAQETAKASGGSIAASGWLGMVLIALALLVDPLFYFPALVAVSLPLLKVPGKRAFGWAGLAFALLAAIVVAGYTVGKDMAERDNAASERSQAR